MWVANQWTDYELLDCGGSEKLERWGDKLLVRPDPQAIWNTPRVHKGWKRPDARYARSSTGGGQWADKGVHDKWLIHYKDLAFNVGLMNFKHTGVFPEQAANWDFAREQIQKAGRPVSVLNLFAYTGGATVACAAAGASVCHVDAARGMVQWAKDNARSSGLEDRPIRWIVDDCAKFVEREIRRGRKYDAVIMDPPSYGRGPSGEVWKLEENLYPFVELVSGVLSDEPLFVILNSYTTGLAPSVLTYILQTVIGGKFGGRTVSDELGLPVTQTGLSLPCGATGRWTAKRDNRRFRMAGLTSMRNIGKELERKLTTVGVDSPEALAELGAKHAFFKLKEEFPQVCLVHLYALEGAIRDIDSNCLPEDTKQDLKEFSDFLKR